MDNFFIRMFKREVAPTGTITTTNATEKNPVSSVGDWKANIVKPTGRKSLLVPAWCRGVSLIMQTMGQMVVQYQKKNVEGENFIEDSYGIGRRINYLLQVRPNPLMTASQMQEQIEFRKIYWGNAYVYIERDQYGDPWNLWLCTGGGYNPLTDTYALTYNRDRGPAVKINAAASDVLHFKSVFMTEDMYMGLPLIWTAMNTLSIAATGGDMALQDMAKGGRVKLLISEEKPQQFAGTLAMGSFAKEQTDAYANEINQKIYDQDVVALRGLEKVQIVSQTAQQLQLLESRGFEVSEIARILGVPRIMMMEDAGSSYKMPEHATQEFMLRTIQPRIREHEDELNSKLLSVDDFGKRRIHVCELPLRRLDAKGQAEIDEIHLRSGWSPNEIRAQYDLAAIPEGNDHYVSTNLAVAGSDKLKGVVSDSGLIKTNDKGEEPTQQEPKEDEK